MDASNIVVRGLIFALGLVLLIDALIDNPTPPLVIVVALVLMGVITVDQLRNLIQRRGGGDERAATSPPPDNTSEPQP